MSATLTEEQKRRIEENRKKALEIRARKEAEKRATELANRNSNVQTFQKPAAAAPAAPPKPSFYSSNSSSSTNNNTSKSVNLFHRAAGTPVTTSSNSITNNQNVVSTAGNTGVTKITMQAHCILISAKEFRVQVGYDSKVMEVFKSHPTHRYDATKRQWIFAIDQLYPLIKRCREVAPHVAFQKMPDFVIKILKSFTKIPLEDIDLSPIDMKLLRSLMPFQKEGVLRGIQQHGRILIADDMGLGKTMQSMAIATYYRDEWPLLIVAPSSMRFSWKDALKRWLPSVTERDIQVIVKTNEPISSTQVVIVSYDLLSRRSSEILEHKFKVVIFDESHFLKGYQSQRTKAGTEVAAVARRIILLSGTPALSRPMELYPQIRCLGLKGLPSFHEFGLRYCNAQERKFGWDYTGSSNLTELNMILSEVIMVRRLKSEVLDQLPDKQRSMVILDPTLVNSKDNKAGEYMSQQMQQDNLSSTEKRGILLQYFCKTAEMKAKSVCKYIEDLLESNQKFLVFAHHSSMMNALCEVLDKKKTGYIRIDGKVGAEQRQKLCDRFQTEEETKVAVLSITAANAGITLHAASLVVFAELFWNPGILMQAEDRVHRIGQKNNCTIQYLIANDTADDYIWPLVQSKLSVLNQAGLSVENATCDEVSEQRASPSYDEDMDDLESTVSTKTKSKSSSGKQKKIFDFMSVTQDSFWSSITQEEDIEDLSLLEPAEKKRRR